MRANSGKAPQAANKRRIGRILNAANVILSLVLLAGAGLGMESAVVFASIPLGFAPQLRIDMTIACHAKYIWQPQIAIDM